MDIPASYDRIAEAYAERLFGELAGAVREGARALVAGGLALVSFHVGDETKYIEELLGGTVDLDFVFFPRATVVGALGEAGFFVEAVVERAPYVEFEYPSTRAYVLARKV